MNVVVAIDSFKGSLSSMEAGKAIKEGILKAGNSDVYISPIADGGEGTVEALVNGMQGTLKTSVVTGPLGEKVSASWGIIDQGNTKTAIIEMAAAAGIVLLKKEELNPLHTTTYGVGELIKEAIKEGCKRFIVGIGGSSTNDGGVGMLQALGYDFLDEKGNPIERGAIGLKDLAYISNDNVIPELAECTFRIACDVKNPLCGNNGCSVIYGPQKGATPEMIKDMDNWLEKYADIAVRDIICSVVSEGEKNCSYVSEKDKNCENISVGDKKCINDLETNRYCVNTYAGDKNYPGTGAAGGMGFAFLTFTNATLEPGIEIVLEETGIEEKIKTADVVVTGEGRMDSQTVMGKAPAGVAQIAKKYGKKVIAFCGCATDDAGVCNDYGIDAYFPILRNVVSIEDALNIDNARKNLMMTAEQVFRLMQLSYVSKEMDSKVNVSKNELSDLSSVNQFFSDALKEDNAVFIDEQIDEMADVLKEFYNGDL